MIFATTIQQVWDGSKTVTRRLVKPGEYERRDFDLPGHPIRQVAHTPDDWVGSDSKVHYFIGQTHPVQPGRGKRAVGRLYVESLDRDRDVRAISESEARLEGFATPLDFLATWCRMHDRGFQFEPDADGGWLLYETRKGYSRPTTAELVERLAARPAERYDAWRIGFHLIEKKEGRG